MKRLLILLLLCIVFTPESFTQRIVYSQPEEKMTSEAEFKIVGKIEENYLVLKSYRDGHYISVYDDNMKLLGKAKQDYMPAKVLGVDIVSYKEFFYLIFQVQNDHVVSCVAAKLNSSGELIGEPTLIDTTVVNYASKSKIYSVMMSDDKKKIFLMKINAKNEKTQIVTGMLLDADMSVIKEYDFGINIANKYSYLTEFNVSNNGDIYFLRVAGNGQNGFIEDATLFYRGISNDSVQMRSVNLRKLFMNDLRLKVDNANRQYLVTSMYSKSRRGNIEGLYCYVGNIATGSEFVTTTLFDDQLRKEAKSGSSVKSAFDDYLLQNITMRKDGGYIISAECIYTTSQNNHPYSGLYSSPLYYSPFAYDYYSPYSMYPGSMYNSQTTKFNADDIAVFSFDANGQMEWVNIIDKSQSNENSDQYVGYTSMTTKDALHYVFNYESKRSMVLNDQSIDAEGKLQNGTLLKNINKDYKFMPRLGKQVSSWQMVIPCAYKGNTCFAKLEF